MKAKTLALILISLLSLALLAGCSTFGGDPASYSPNGYEARGANSAPGARDAERDAEAAAAAERDAEAAASD